MSNGNVKVNTVFNTLKTVSTILFNLITFPYIARILLTENVGKVNFSISFVNYFALIASLGVTTYAIRECAKRKDNAKGLEDISSQIFSINFYMTFLSYIALALVLVLFRSFDSYRVLIIILSTNILFTTLGTDWINSAMEDFKYIAIRTLAFQVLSLIAVFVFVRNIGDYYKYAIITVISTSGANILNIFYRRRFCRIKLFSIKRIEWKVHMSPILFLFVMILAQTIFSNADITMLGLIKDDVEVGLYSTAHKVENIISQVISSIAWVMIPKLSRMFENNDYEGINNQLSNIFGFYMVLGLPCFVGAIITAPDIIDIIAGTEYAGAAMPLQILMFSFLFSLVGGSFLGNMVLLPSGNEKRYMFVCCAATVVNVIANLILIPLWGARAAAGTTAFCSLFIASLLLFLKDKRIKINGILKNVLSPLIGSVAIVGFCLIMQRVIDGLALRMIACIVGSIILYAIVLAIFKNKFMIWVIHFCTGKLKKNHDERC